MVYESVGGFLLPIYIVMFLEEIPMEDLTNFHHVIDELIERKKRDVSNTGNKEGANKP